MANSTPLSVEISEVLRRSEHGMTKPFICRGDDKKGYFVKGIGAGRQSQIKEWIAGQLGTLIGVPVAPFKIVNISDELFDGLPPSFATELGCGPAFGSTEQRIMELSWSQISEIPLQLRQLVLCFDWWILNNDRMLTDQGGNPNLFWEPGSRDLVVIDHNQAFDRDFSRENFFKFHAFKDCASGIADDLVERGNYTSLMDNALKHWQSIVDGLPLEWFYTDPEMTIEINLSLDSIFEELKRYENNDFWDWE